MIKWIGQHIFDLIARFRGDVYLENISSGTIASGGNLGLDSDNKIVKEADTGITDLHGAGVDGSANQLLTDDGDGTVTSEAGLIYDSETLTIGNNDDGVATIKRATHSDGDGGDMYVRGGDATDGQTNKAGGGVRLYAGRSTGNESGGNIGIFGVPSGSSGTSLNSVDTTQAIAVFKSDNKTTTLGGNLIFEGATPDANETTFSITDPTTDRTITVPDASGTMALTGVAEHYQYISFLGNSTVQANGDWEFPGGNGISNHTWAIDANESATTVGSTTISVTQAYQHAGIRVPYAGKLVGVFGAGRNANGDRQFAAGLFVGVPDWGTTNAINATLRSYAAANNESGAYTNRASKIEDLTRDFSLSAGDMIYPAIRGDGNVADTIQISMTVVIKTAIPS